MSYGIRISKAGYDVVQETDPKNMIFDSDYNHLKTAGSGTLTKTVGTGSSSITEVTHTLGVRPLVIAYFHKDGINKWYICMAQPETTSTRQYEDFNVEVYVTTTKVTFNFINSSGSSVDFELKYEYFYEGDS